MVVCLLGSETKAADDEDVKTTLRIVDCFAAAFMTARVWAMTAGTTSWKFGLKATNEAYRVSLISFGAYRMVLIK